MASSLLATRKPSPGKNTMNDVSWGLKVKLLKNLDNGRGFGVGNRRDNANVMQSSEHTESDEISSEDDNELNEYELEKEEIAERLKSRRADDEISPDYLPPDIANRPIKEAQDEKDMKLKLFRLMYETVKDNDIQTKTAEKIKNEYSKSVVFEIGYIIADITDKYEIMFDTGATMKRLFDDWKPVEHVNAYEQITNQGVEINQLIDLLKTLKPNNSTRRWKRPRF